MPPESSDDYTPTNLDKIFERLDNKLVTLGIPGALSYLVSSYSATSTQIQVLRSLTKEDHTD